MAISWVSGYAPAALPPGFHCRILSKYCTESKRLSGEPVKEARLIGDILGNFPIGVGDWWYAKRIEAFIKDGKIKVIEDSENKYARLIL